MGKSFWGGLRIGWIRADRELIAALATSRASLDMGSPILEQLAAAVLLRDAEPSLEARRASIRAQRDFLLGQVRDRLADWHFAHPEGGLSAWAELPLPVSTALAAAMHRRGVRIAPGTRFGVDGAFERFLRLPYALPIPSSPRWLTGWSKPGTRSAPRHLPARPRSRRSSPAAI